MKISWLVKFYCKDCGWHQDEEINPAASFFDIDKLAQGINLVHECLSSQSESKDEGSEKS